MRQRAREERSSWNEHRRREANNLEAIWLAHVANWTDKNGDPIRASSDSVKVRQQLLDAGVLFPLSDRSTLRLDDAARSAIAEPWRAWSAEELLA
jgi:hypothetical protein